MKTIDDINLHTWFIDRNLNPCPDHFVKTNTILTPEAIDWIYEKLTGRFSTGHTGIYLGQCPSFEDPKEAMMYELTWG